MRYIELIEGAQKRVVKEDKASTKYGTLTIFGGDHDGAEGEMEIEIAVDQSNGSFEILTDYHQEGMDNNLYFRDEDVEYQVKDAIENDDVEWHVTEGVRGRAKEYEFNMDLDDFEDDDYPDLIDVTVRYEVSGEARPATRFQPAEGEEIYVIGIYKNGQEIDIPNGAEDTVQNAAEEHYSDEAEAEYNDRGDYEYDQWRDSQHESVEEDADLALIKKLAGL